MRLPAIVGAEVPAEYRELTDEEMGQRIYEHKQRHGDRLVILTHQYQRPEIVDIGDYLGDSLDLARKAVQSEAKFIVFCGVQFMAQSAEILRKDFQRVYHPDLTSGCPLADFGDMDDVEYAWEQITKIVGEQNIIPIAYINSYADLKAFIGRNGGAICTSSNVRSVFEWAYQCSEKIFFLPDEHLGVNTAKRMGIPKDRIVVWNFRKRREPFGGLTAEEIKRADLILWKGYCHVHTFFKPNDVRRVRQEHPDAIIVVHPECMEEVVDMADAFGSTSFIARFVKEAPKGTKIAIGTELHLITRLARDYSDKVIFPIKKSICGNMFKISLHDLLYTLDNLEESVNLIKIPSDIRDDARLALERMLEIR